MSIDQNLNETETAPSNNVHSGLSIRKNRIIFVYDKKTQKIRVKKRKVTKNKVKNFFQKIFSELSHG